MPSYLSWAWGIPIACDRLDHTSCMGASSSLGPIPSLAPSNSCDEYFLIVLYKVHSHYARISECVQ
eukprot:scaffold112847_cov13-Cyclotella_meneghiniana.AAC.1